MKKLISFSLYGNDPKYIQGMFRNIELKKEFYPDWDIIIYHDNSLEPDVIKRLSQSAHLKNFTDSGMLAASWRFCAFDEPDLDRFIVRDADSRLSRREVEAVSEWEDSNRSLHIMRDHPHHGHPILGGMWGLKSDVGIISMKDKILEYQGGKVGHITNRDNWSMADMNFLRDVIYSTFATPSLCKIQAAQDYMHKASWNNESWTEDFPTKRNTDKNFVGEIITFDNEDNEIRGPQYQELLDC